MEINIVILRYEIDEKIPVSYGHKLRGFFAEKFEEILFHQHDKNGNLRYQYPLIQYKVIDSSPFIVGLNKGSDLITEKFLEIDKLILNDKEFINPTSKLKVKHEELKVNEKSSMLIYKYNFITPWLGLSQKNYQKYVAKIKKDSEDTRKLFLSKIITGNILSFGKGINWWIEDNIYIFPNLKEISVNFKGQKMIGFVGNFYSNVKLPDYIGLGKSTSRGFGTITGKKIK